MSSTPITIPSSSKLPTTVFTPPTRTPKLLEYSRKWQPDESATRCTRCADEFTNSWFSLSKRRHHCRLCRRVFCHDCSPRRAKIPKFVAEHYEATEHVDAVRVCLECETLVNDLQRVWYVIDALIACGEFDVTIVEWYALYHASRPFRVATQYLFSVWRKVQSIETSSAITLTPTQAELLEINAGCIHGHPRLEIVFALVEQQRPLTRMSRRRERVACDMLCCPRYCTREHKMTPADSLAVLLNCTSADLRARAFRSVFACADSANAFVGTLVYVASVDRHFLNRALLPYVRDHPRFAHNSYWVARSFGMSLNEVRAEILKICDPHVREEIELSRRWVVAFECAMKSDDAAYRQQLMHGFDEDAAGNLPIYPGLPTHRIKRTHMTKLRVLKSSTTPYLVPITLVNEATGEETRRDVLFKKEKLLNDHLVESILAYLDVVVREESMETHDIVRYPVLPLSRSSGLILTVPRSRTIYEIEDVRTLLENVENVETFDKSVALWTVLTLALGLGDRHTRNILVSEDGRIFHVDFSFILGRQPPLQTTLLETLTSKIRMPTTLIDMVKRSKESFDAFRARCKRLHLLLSRHVGEIFFLLYPLIVQREFTERELRDILQKNFERDILTQDLILEHLLANATTTTQRNVNTLFDYAHSLSARFR